MMLERMLEIKKTKIKEKIHFIVIWFENFIDCCFLIKIEK